MKKRDKFGKFIKQPKIERTCKECGKVFEVIPYRIKIGEGKYCTTKCFGESQKSKKRPQFSGKNHPNWKGGKKIKGGYLFILMPDHPRATEKGYVKNSHLVMEQKIGRFIQLPEVVHHIDGDKLNDTTSNLYLCKDGAEHIKFHYPRRSNDDEAV